MTKTGQFLLGSVGCAILLIAGDAKAQAPDDLRDLVGGRAGQAEGELSRRGYDFIWTQEGSDRKWGYWWNARRQTCVSIATVNGRYDSITVSPAPDCRQTASSTNYPSSPPGRPGYGNQAGSGYDDSYDRGRSLTLICYGEGRKPGANFRSGYEWNSRRNRYEYRSIIENGQQRFDSEVQVELRGGRGHIHLTGKLVPPIHSGGVDGWWPIDGLRVDRTRITGQYRLNGLNKPKIEIDRRSGRIRIDGIERFRGECDVGDWSGSNNRF
jgi:hypothetical protein